MRLGFCGISYKEAGLDIRDKVAFTDGKKAQMFREMEGYGIHQCMILSTCNRSEVYYFYETEEQEHCAEKIYGDMFPGVGLETYLKQKTGEDAVVYLFQVTAGIRSQIIGEDQILGQVKDAYDFAKTMGYCQKEMNRVVRDAITCAKRIRTELKISEIPLSVSYVGIQQLEKRCGIQGKKVLIVGSGQTSVLALRYVHDYGAAEIILCNRTMSRALQLKKEFPKVKIRSFDERYDAIKECDIVISATSAPHVIIKNHWCELDHRVYFLDLAAPRDVEVELMNNPYAELMNLDMLEGIVQDNQKERELLAEKGQKIINQAVEGTFNWLLTTRVDDTIKSLQAKCDEIAEDSFAYLDRKLDLNDRELRIVKRTLKASFTRLLKEPILELKRVETREEQDQYKDTLAKLFQI